MKENKKVELFRKFAQEWIDRTWVGWWHVDLLFLKADDYAKLKKDIDPECSVALTETSWQYMTARISVNLDVLNKRIKKKEIEYVVVHEMMHIFLNEMREKGIKHEERVATMLAHSFIRTKEVGAGEEVEVHGEEDVNPTEA